MEVGGNLIRSSLESDRGFLIYVACTYQEFNPYHKVIHIKIDGWIPEEDNEGWKYPTIHLLVGHSNGKWYMTS